jgi:D-beta-D-heptose 7-phosphate kinase/D-beta-D-heptose 1-phosphate adenosyltransferase
MISKKIKTREDLSEIIREKKISGEKTGFTNGCFDILHPGHVKYLEAARKACDFLVVGVNSDGSVRRLKGSERPINTARDRMDVLAALASVDFLTMFEEDTPEELVRALSPDILFKGGDWEEKDIAGSGFVRANGGEVIIVEFEKGYSTTRLIEKIRGKQDGMADLRQYG